MIVHDPKAREDVEGRDRPRSEGIWNIDDVDIFLFLSIISLYGIDSCVYSCRSHFNVKVLRII